MLRQLCLPVLVVASLLAPGVAQPSEAQGFGERLLRGGVIAAQGLFINTATEVQIGQQTAAAILAKSPEVTDPALRAYVAGVGAKVAARAERKDVAYTFHVIQDPAVNAFSTAGGFVFITTACLGAMQNEAQLAGVLGHEVGHVVHKDAIKAIKQQLVASGLATTVMGDNASQLEAAAINVGATLVLRGYGRKAEFAADLLGARYAAEAGYDPRQLGTFLGVLATKSGNPSPWLMPLADHPRSDDRIARLNAFVAQQHLAGANLAVGQAPYEHAVRTPLARIGGGAGR